MISSKLDRKYGARFFSFDSRNKMEVWRRYWRYALWSYFTQDGDPPGVPYLRVGVDGRETVEAGLGCVEVGEEDGVEVTSLLQDTVLTTTQSLLAMEPTNV